MLLPTSTVGRKILMAVTGQMMVLFVIIHLLGNTTIYFSNLNAYAAALHALPVLLWMIRLFMVAMLCLHIYFGIVVTLENKKAKPQVLCRYEPSQHHIRRQEHDLDRLSDRRVPCLSPPALYLPDHRSRCLCDTQSGLPLAGPMC